MITAFGAGQQYRRARHEAGCYMAQELDASRLTEILERVADHKINKLDGLRPWNYLPETQVQDAYLLYRGVFIKNLLRYLAEETLLLKPLILGGITLELPRHRRDQISAYIRTLRHLRENAQQV